MHCKHSFSTHIAEWMSRDSVSQHAIDQQVSIDFDRQKHPGISATRAYRVNQRTCAEDYAISCRKIGCCDCERNSQFLKGFNPENSIKEADHSLTVGEAHAGNCPAGKYFKAYASGNLLQFVRRNSTAIGSSDERAHARTGHKTDWNVLLLENLQYADMSYATGKTSAQGDANA